MKILFDIISTQGFKNGAAEYVLRVLSELLACSDAGVEVVCLYDSQEKFPYDETSPQALAERGVVTVDIRKKPLGQLITDEQIDLLFIGIAQRFVKYDYSQITCQCVCVVHDFYDFDLDGIYEYLYRKNFFMWFLKKMIRIRNAITKKKSRQEFYSFLSRKENLNLVTVSEFTRASLLNKVVGADSKIEVLYSPEKLSHRDEQIENGELRAVVQSQQKYFLIVSAGRIVKNAVTAINAFMRYAELYAPDVKLVTIGYGRRVFANHIDLPFLSTSDLEHAYLHCHALLYPSLWEGFGYPPLEAMKYGKPVVCSNVCSMKEVLGQAPIYFSPFYESDIFAALLRFHQCDYQSLSEVSLACYQRVSKRQQDDLARLVNLITRNHKSHL